MSVYSHDTWKCDRCELELVVSRDETPHNGWTKAITATRVDMPTQGGRIWLLCPQCTDELATWLITPTVAAS